MAFFPVLSVCDAGYGFVDGKTRERIEITGSKMPEFTNVRRPHMNELKFKYEHARNKKF